MKDPLSRVAATWENCDLCQEDFNHIHNMCDRQKCKTQLYWLLTNGAHHILKDKRHVYCHLDRMPITHSQLAFSRYIDLGNNRCEETCMGVAMFALKWLSQGMKMWLIDLHNKLANGEELIINPAAIAAAAAGLVAFAKHSRNTELTSWLDGPDSRGLYKYANAIRKGKDFIDPLIALNYFDGDELEQCKMTKHISIRQAKRSRRTRIPIDIIKQQSDGPCLKKTPGHWVHLWVTEDSDLLPNVTYKLEGQ